MTGNPNGGKVPLVTEISNTPVAPAAGVPRNSLRSASGGLPSSANPIRSSQPVTSDVKQSSYVVPMVDKKSIIPERR